MEHWTLIHASDFRLGEPLVTPWELGADLDERLVQAPYEAVRRLTELACDQKPHALLLSGNLLHPLSCGAYALAFLEEQFAQLAKAQVPVFWALGPLDQRPNWRSMPQWPSNVHVFDSSRWTRHSLSSGSHRMEIVGRSFGGDVGTPQRTWPAASSREVPMVIVASLREVDIPASAQGSYWALGGAEAAGDGNSDMPVMRYCGSPQPRSATGNAGSATWVEVFPNGDVQWEAVPLATVAMATIRLECPSGQSDSVDGLVQAVLEDARLRCSNTESESDGCDCQLVTYIIEGASPRVAWLMADPQRRQKCVMHIQEHCGSADWHVVDLACASQPVAAEQTDGTVLGDFLAELNDGDDALAAHLDRDAPPPWCDRRRLPSSGKSSGRLRTVVEQWAVAALSGDTGPKN